MSCINNDLHFLNRHKFQHPGRFLKSPYSSLMAVPFFIVVSAVTQGIKRGHQLLKVRQ
jgi:hypothetical protein